MSWPAAKSTIITVESVMEPGCDGDSICDIITVTWMHLSMLAEPVIIITVTSLVTQM